MRAIFRKARPDLWQRRLQSLLTLLILWITMSMGATAALVLANTNQPFEHAFAQFNGPHLVVDFDGKQVSDAALADLANLPEIAAAEGPFITADVPVRLNSQSKDDLMVVGSSPEQPNIGHLDITAGHFLSAGDSGAIVINQAFADRYHLQVGDTIQALTSPAKPRLHIVGLELDVDQGNFPNWFPARAYMLAEALPTLFPAASPPTDRQMLFRLHHADDETQVDEALKDITAHVPSGAITFSYSWLLVQQVVTTAAQFPVIFLIAFSIFALFASGLIIANVIGGAVLAQFREIGILKAIGFRRGQILWCYLLQMLLLGLLAGIAGFVTGILLAPLLLNQVARLVASPVTVSLSPILLFFLLLLLELLVALFTCVPAWRASRIPAVRAITTGFSQPRQKPSWLGILAARLKLPRSIVLGAKESFARRGRAALTIISLALGIITAVFALGLNSTIAAFQANPSLSGIYADMAVTRGPAFSDEQTQMLLKATPQIVTYYTQYQTDVHVQGTNQQITLYARGGNTAAFPFAVQQGHWLQGPDDIVVGSGILSSYDLHIGDPLRVRIANQTATFQIVGQMIDFNNFGEEGVISFPTLLRYLPQASPDSYWLRLKPGTDKLALQKQLETQSDDLLTVDTLDTQAAGPLVILQITMLVLSLALTVIAALSVFNTTLLDTREHYQDIGILKAIGLTPRQVSIMVSSSATVLLVVALVIGIPLGMLLTNVLINVLAASIQAGTIPTSTSIVGLVILLPVAWIVVLLASYLPSRRAARLPVAEILRYQ